MAQYFTVTFYWDGKMHVTHYQADHLPKDKLEADGLVWGAIRKWFKDHKLTIPEYVRNITFYSDKTYKWEVMSMASSADGLK